jgi:CRP-like cAMP-binding protein
MDAGPSALITFITQSGLVDVATARNIAEYFTPVTFNKNDFFLKTGRVSNEYLFLESGCMRAYTHDTAGNEVTTNFYTGNQVVFEPASYFLRTYTKENIQALSDCHGRAARYEQVQLMFHSIPAFREFGRSMLVKGFAALKERMLGMINQTAEQRYEQLLRQKPEILQLAPLKHIASYLGVTDTSLSRIRKELLKK